ncbi:DUF2760 domain-containing protein [Thalassoglobus sp.]|uniref:DUF2760 domain-containing protein n=1 Tax=Thalassoglobus sp. TaxID=2795869 RepID=UPI003AA7CDF6
MGRFILAFKTFFKVLGNADFAKQLDEIAEGSARSKIEQPAPKPQEPPAKPKPEPRNGALTLLEALQREARLLDFIQEDLSTYQDAQVGAAVRDVHRGCREVFDRYFSLQACLDQEEGVTIEVTEDTDASQVRLIGNVVETRPVSGTLVHSGWKAAKCALPDWVGKEQNKNILAPAEVEIS